MARAAVVTFKKAVTILICNLDTEAATAGRLRRHTLARLLGCQSSIQSSPLFIVEKGLGAQALHAAGSASEAAATFARHVLTELA